MQIRSACICIYMDTVTLGWFSIEIDRACGVYGSNFPVGSTDTTIPRLIRRFSFRSAKLKIVGRS